VPALSAVIGADARAKFVESKERTARAYQKFF
jgi:hypothetical protein